MYGFVIQQLYNNGLAIIILYEIKYNLHIS